MYQTWPRVSSNSALITLMLSNVVAMAMHAIMHVDTKMNLGLLYVNNATSN